MRRLETTEMLVKHKAVIQHQLVQDVVEQVETQAEGQKFYVPHKAVVLETAKTTKLCIVVRRLSKGP